MAAKTATSRIGRTMVQRLYNLHQELSETGTTNLASNTTTTLTIVHTAATNAITIDSSST